MPRGLVLLLPSSCQSPQHSKHVTGATVLPSLPPKANSRLCLVTPGQVSTLKGRLLQARQSASHNAGIQLMLLYSSLPWIFLRGSLPSEFLTQRSRDKAYRTTQGVTLRRAALDIFSVPPTDVLHVHTHSTILSKPKAAVLQDAGAQDSLHPQKNLSSTPTYPVSTWSLLLILVFLFLSSFTANVNYRPYAMVGNSKTTFCCLPPSAPSPE